MSSEISKILNLGTWDENEGMASVRRVLCPWCAAAFEVLRPFEARTWTESHCPECLREMFWRCDDGPLGWVGYSLRKDPRQTGARLAAKEGGAQ